MEQRVQPPTTSTIQGTVSDRLPTAPIVESNTTLSQSNSYVPPSSTYSSDSELNNALHALLDNEKVGQEDTVASGGMVPFLFDPLFPFIPLPQTTDLLPQRSNLLSQQEFQSSSMGGDVLKTPTSTTDCTVFDSLPLEDSGTTLSVSTSYVPTSSTYSSDRELNDALHALTSGVKGSRENDETADGMDVNIFDIFFPLFPLPQTTDQLPPDRTSQLASKNQGINTFQPTTHSHHSSLDCLPASSSALPSSPALALSAYSCSAKWPSVNSKNSDGEKKASETEWIRAFDMFSLVPLPEGVDLLPLGMSQPVSVEKRVQPPATSTTQVTVSDRLPTAPIVESNRTLSQSNSYVPPSSTYSSDPELNNVVCTLLDDKSSGKESMDTPDDYIDPYIFDLFFQVPLIPLPKITDPSPPELSLSVSKEQGVDSPQRTSSSARSQPSSSCTSEKTASEMEPEPIFDLFSLIPLSQTTNLSPQGVSQSASREQRVDTFQLTASTAPPHHLPVDQTTNVQREMDTPSPCAPSSHSSVDVDEGDASAYVHTNPDSSCSQEESIQATLGEQSMASYFSSPSSSTEIATQTEVESNVKPQNRTSKPKKALSVIQQQRQRMLNKVSALHYRKRKKELRSDLEVRKEQLETENTRLKEQVSVLTTEIAKLKRLSKTRKAKFCPFFFHSTCKKVE